MCGFPTKACDNVRSKRGSVAFAQQVCFGMCLDLLLVSVFDFLCVVGGVRPACCNFQTHCFWEGRGRARECTDREVDLVAAHKENEATRSRPRGRLEATDGPGTVRSAQRKFFVWTEFRATAHGQICLVTMFSTTTVSRVTSFIPSTTQ